MEKVREYLEKFKPAAKNWLEEVTIVREYRDFFKEFFKRENLEKAEWKDVQKLGEHLHSFGRMAIAKGRALGNPNHPIEHYRKSFIYLAHGKEDVVERIRNFHRNKDFKLKNFGPSVISEIVGNLFADRFIFRNERDQFAAEFLRIPISYQRGDDLAAELVNFSEAMKPVAEEYERIVGRQTDLPINLELDQFFSWVYKNYSRNNEEKKSKMTQNHWLFAPGRNGEHWEEFYEKGIAAIGWDDLGDLTKYSSKKSIQAKIEEGREKETSASKTALACYQFANEIQIGDWIYAKKGRKSLVGIGRVESDHFFDDSRETYKHVRQVKWLEKGNFPIPNEEQFNIKTLTKIKDEKRIEILQGFVRDDSNKASSTKKLSMTFSSEDALKKLFMSQEQFETMLSSLRQKKNIILQGPPGVGKTFAARLLAYALLEAEDANRVEMIQFHQSFSYEDFIQGFRPTVDGKFKLKDGLFYRFCRKAQSDAEGKPYILIIDEINRGNLSKIFGELLMLIEPDKRGRDFAIPLTYSECGDEKFFVPENLYIIGTMNTADRSLALVDYALRRRFRFIDLKPEFRSDRFSRYLSERGASSALVKKIIERINSLNDAISVDTKNLGAGYQIGHSYFCLRDGQAANEEWYTAIIREEIIPLLQEYWFDDEIRIKDRETALLE